MEKYEKYFILFPLFIFSSFFIFELVSSINKSKENKLFIGENVLINRDTLIIIGEGNWRSNTFLLSNGIEIEVENAKKFLIEK